MGPLTGVRVVEVGCEHVAWAGRLLADLGAEVTVVEPPGGSVQRTYGPFADDRPGPERSLWWWHYHASKRSVVSDLSRPDDRLLRLVERADVLLVSDDDAALAPAGLDWPTRSAADPRVVMVSVTPFGRDSHRRDEPVTDLTLLAESGPVWSCGYDDHSLPPVRGGGNQALQAAGNWAVMTLLVALVARDRTGTGQLIDVSMVAAGNVTTEMATYTWLLAGWELQRQTGRHASVTPTAPVQVRCADGRYATTGVPPREPAEYRALLDLLERTGLRDEFPDAAVLELGAERDTALDFADVGRDPLVAVIVTAARDVVWFLAERLDAHRFFVETQSIGLATGIVYTPDEALADAHFVERGFPVHLEHPEIDRPYTAPGAPYRFTTTPATVGRAPLLGEHQADLD